MIFSLKAVLLIVSIVLFVIAGLGVSTGRVRIGHIGIAFFIAGAFLA